MIENICKRKNNRRKDFTIEDGNIKFIAYYLEVKNVRLLMHGYANNKFTISHLRRKFIWKNMLLK